MALLINATVHCVSARTENSVSWQIMAVDQPDSFSIMNNGNTRPPAS